jgi:hypothetical protein
LGLLALAVGKRLNDSTGVAAIDTTPTVFYDPRWQFLSASGRRGIPLPVLSPRAV